MKRAAAILVAIMIAAAVLLTITTSTAPQPTLTVTTNHVAVSKFAKTAPVGYSATLNWQMAFAGTTGYFVLNNGTQVADVASSPYTYTGLDCGQSLTFTVQAHNGSGTVLGSITAPYSTPACQVFPLKVASSGTFLQTASGKPFLMVGDSPQSLMGFLSKSVADSYFADRASEGFNAVWWNLVCSNYTFCPSSGIPASGIASGVAPFTSGTTPSTYSFGAGACGNCSSTYFAAAHTLAADAEADGLEVVLDPMSTDGCVGGDFMTTLENNGNGTTSSSTADYKYGQFLGTTFKDLPNVMWMSGNDFQCVGTSTDNNDALAVALGIQNTDPTALQTLEPDGCSGLTGFTCEGSSSLVSAAGSATGWSSVVNLNGTYTYSPTFGEDRLAYSQSTTQPMLLLEGNYEGEKFAGNTDGCQTDKNCRLQEWWTMTSGATGQLYGNYFTDAIGCGCSHGGGAGTVPANSFNTSDIDTTAVAQLKVQTTFLNSIAWQTLAPDTGGNIVTSGTGSCSTVTGSYTGSTCVTTASDYAGAGTATLALTYLPDPSSFASPVVNLASFAGAVTARWLDPTNGSFTPIAGSPFTNSGTHTFTPSTNNAAGDKDWVLVLQG